MPYLKVSDIHNLEHDTTLDAKRVTEISSLIPDTYDYVEVTARDANLNPTTIVYKIGGSGGTIVATLTLTYTVDGCFESVSTA